MSYYMTAYRSINDVVIYDMEGRMITSNVKKLMNDNGITIRGMVAISGLSDKTILRARCEDIIECRLYTLQTLAKFLKCNVKDLFDEGD